MSDVKSTLPLTEAFYYILLALYIAPAHGYAIMQQTAQISNKRVLLGAGTLYTALNTLLHKGLISLLEAAPETDTRRKVYSITDIGREVMLQELYRLEELVKNGKDVMIANGGYFDAE